MGKKKSENARRQRKATLFMMALGVIMGYGMSRYMLYVFPPDTAPADRMRVMLVLMVMMPIAARIHTVIHEAGHLVFGLLSGYRFGSFRVGRHMVMKRDGKLVHKKIRIAGTSGQCLLVPPEMKDGRMPVIACNLGGSAMNLIACAVFAVPFTLAEPSGYVSLFCFMMIVVGFISGLSNAIPLRTGKIDNDGYNALSLSKNPEAIRAFWIQMKVSEQLSLGLRLKDMPDEWFQQPSDEDMKSNLIASVGVFRCYRLMDQRRFEEARQLIEHMLENAGGMAGMHRNMLICDRMYLELIGENRPGVLAELYNKEQKRFMKAAKSTPGVIRTEYAYAIAAERNEWKAHLAMRRFEKLEKCYPYAGEIRGERELMALAASVPDNRAAVK